MREERDEPTSAPASEADSPRASAGTPNRSEIDALYEAAYREHPLDEADEWGDLASFLQAAAQPLTPDARTQ